MRLREKNMAACDETRQMCEAVFSEIEFRMGRGTDAEVTISYRDWDDNRDCEERDPRGGGDDDDSGAEEAGDGVKRRKMTGEGGGGVVKAEHDRRERASVSAPRERLLSRYPWLQYFPTSYVRTYVVTTTATGGMFKRRRRAAVASRVPTSGPPFTYFPLLCCHFDGSVPHPLAELACVKRHVGGDGGATTDRRRSVESDQERNARKEEREELRLLHTIATGPGVADFVLAHLCFAASARGELKYDWSLPASPCDSSRRWNRNVAAVVSTVLWGGARPSGDANSFSYFSTAGKAGGGEKGTLQRPAYARFFVSDVWGERVRPYLEDCARYRDDQHLAARDLVRALAAANGDLDRLNPHSPPAFALCRTFLLSAKSADCARDWWLLDPRRGRRWNRERCAEDPAAYVWDLAKALVGGDASRSLPVVRNYLDRLPPACRPTCVFFAPLADELHVRSARQSYGWFDRLCVLFAGRFWGGVSDPARFAEHSETKNERRSDEDRLVAFFLTSLRKREREHGRSFCCDESRLRFALAQASWSSERVRTV